MTFRGKELPGRNTRRANETNVCFCQFHAQYMG